MFNNAITIGTIARIPIRLHLTLLLAFPLLTWLFGTQIATMAQEAGLELSQNVFVLGLILTLALFVSVGLHELGHALVARGRGIHIKDITLMLFGGVAQLDEEFSHNPANEFAIALAGPAVSLGLGLGALVFAQLMPVPDLYVVIFYLAWLNIVLAVFNLLPAFPTDGGRILRSLLARKMSYLAATRFAVSLGQLFAVLFGVFGFLSGNFFLIFIAVFVYMGASQEYQASLLRQTLSGFTVADLMTAKISSVPANYSVQQLVEQMYRERHSGYPVMKEGRLVGCVTMEDIQKVEPRLREFKTVEDIMSTEIKAVAPEDDIYLALRRLSELEIGRLFVLKDEQLVGIITRTDIMKGFRLRLLESER